MHSVLLVTYDLVQPGRNYENLLALIRNFPSWARLGGSAYLILTTENPLAVRDRLARVLDANDKLYVGVVSAPAAWIGLPEDVSNWIRSNLR